jgi:ribosomal protein L30, bacterial/organelle
VEDETMAKIKIKQVKSRINCPAVQKRTLDALGLRKLNHVVEHEATPQILGMVSKISHLVKVVE